MSCRTSCPVDTYFAPAKRADAKAVHEQRGGFLGISVGQALLEAMPGPALVINEDRQILSVNGQLLDLMGIKDAMGLIGLRPGEALGCTNVATAPSGCGTGRACGHCGAVGAILEALETRGRSMRECRLLIGGPPPAALDLRVHATFLAIDGEHYVVLGLQDIGPEKRREVLERAFFHDLLNTCGGVQGLAELLVDLEADPQAEQALKRDLVQLSHLMVDEIRSHQQMLAAERGDLQLDLAAVDVPAFLAELVAIYRNHVVRGSRTLALATVPPVNLRTDASLLRRVLGNLIKNALEAAPDGAAVTVRTDVSDGEVAFTVHNPGAMPAAVQLQVFQRSFSTKGGTGRGIGTYAARLFCERYLGGKVSFTSDDAAGTAFTVTLPRRV